MSLKFGINLAQHVAIPKKLLTAFVLVCGRALSIDSTLTGSGEISFSENKKEILRSLNSQLLLFKLFEHCLNSLIMISLGLAKDDDIITYVQHSRDVTNLLTDLFLEDFTG